MFWDLNKLNLNLIILKLLESALIDRELVTELNNCYSLALLYELNLNRKDYGTFFKILEVCLGFEFIFKLFRNVEFIHFFVKVH